MKTAMQLAKEFCAPFLVALLWTAWQMWPSFELKTAIANFGTSFFLASWASGQIFRVKKQQKIERDLTDLLEKTQAAATAIHERTVQVLDYLSGGESFVCLDLQVWKRDDGTFEPKAWLRNAGSIEPMYNVSAWITDNQRESKSSTPYGWEHKVDLLLPHATEPVNWDLLVRTGQTRIDLSVAVTARNRGTRQRIVVLLLNDKWIIATKVETVGYRENWDLLTLVPREFPRLSDGSPDWFNESDSAALTPTSPATGATSSVVPNV